MSAFWRWGLVCAVLAGIGGLFVLSPSPKGATDRPLAPLSQPAGAPVTILFMGTSLTSGGTWPDLVADRLRACGMPALQMLRMAEGGVTSVWGRARLETVVAAAPDVIVLEFSINDADLRRGLSLAASREAHRALISGLKQGLPEARIVLMTMNPATGLRRLLRPRLAAYYALYHDLAAELDLGLIDLYPRWLALPHAARGPTDGVHPAADSAALVIVPPVTAYLGRLLGQACAA